MKWGWLDSSPAARASAPAQRTAQKLVTPTPEMVGTLIHDAEESDPVMAAAVALAFVTGGRRGELCGLRWSDIDLEVGTVRIERSLTQIGEELIEKGTKTDRGRTVALEARAVALLRRHQAWQTDLADRAQSPLVDDPYVLSDNADGALPIPPSKITDRFTALRRRAKIRSVRFHHLRHAHVTGFGAGVDATSGSQSRPRFDSHDPRPLCPRPPRRRRGGGGGHRSSSPQGRNKLTIRRFRER